MTDNRERTAGLLPPDSRGLFQDGELQDHNFAESSFTEDDVGASATEFDLTNADTSHVQDMSFISSDAESFDQDIGNWDKLVVELVKYPASEPLLHLRFPDRNPDGCGCSIEF